MELILKAVPIRRGSQPERQSYIATLLFGDVARLLQDNRLYVPNQPDLPDLAQRKPNATRVKEIARYILETYEDGMTFFPPICVNVQPRPTYRDGSIFLPYYDATLRLTDGQHRCFGIQKALQDLQEQDSEEFRILSQLEVGVLIYAGLSLEEERQAFRDQNLLVQRPSVSLSHYFDKRSPAVLIAKELLKRVPQFHDNVETVEKGLGSHNPNLLTLSTLVTATKHMFPSLNSNSHLESKIDWAAAFWLATAKVLPDDPWSLRTKEQRCQQRRESIAVSAPIFQALGILARDLYQEDVPAPELVKWLTRLREIDWQRDNQFWLERGVTQIGMSREPIISNTKTTVNVCHQVLREFVGVGPLSGVI